MRSASARSRQKSLRGFAKCAAAAAERNPGLIPQKMTAQAGSQDVRDRRLGHGVTLRPRTKGGRKWRRPRRLSGRSRTTSAEAGSTRRRARASTSRTRPAARRWRSVPMSSRADLDRAVRSRAAGVPRMARDLAGRARPRLLPAEERPRGAQGRARRDRLPRQRQGDQGRGGRGPARNRVRRGGHRDPVAHAGLEPGGRLPRDRLRHDPPADRRLRRHHAVQLPLHGAALVPPVRDRVRRHVHPQAVRAGPSRLRAALRAARPVRDPRRRGQPPERRQGHGQRDPRAPGDQRRLVRRLDPGRAPRLRDRGQAR